MLGKILPFLFLLAGAATGIGGGYLFVPPSGHEALPDETGERENTPAADAEAEFIKMNNQFVVPVTETDRIAALVVLSLSLEAEPGQREAIYEREPKLRDAFLRILFDHANMGGFAGAFTAADRLEPLRAALREAAQAEFGPAIRDVLITEIARQDT